MSKYIPLLSIFFLFISCGIGIPWEVIEEEIIENYPDDNPYEEMLEDWIEEYTGIEIDITGDSEEKYPHNKKPF